MATRVAGLTGATLPTAPSVCHECIWWQARPGRSLAKEKWIERAEAEWGASLPEVGREVQRRVRDYLGRMADIDPEAVDVVVDEVAAPA